MLAFGTWQNTKRNSGGHCSDGKKAGIAVGISSRHRADQVLSVFDAAISPVVASNLANTGLLSTSAAIWMSSV